MLTPPWTSPTTAATVNAAQAETGARLPMSTRVAADVAVFHGKES
jgi:hypothetical protein